MPRWTGSKEKTGKGREEGNKIGGMGEGGEGVLGRRQWESLNEETEVRQRIEER